MINDPQYKTIIKAFETNNKFTDDEHNAAVVIAGKMFYPLNNKKQDIIQALPDKSLYNLLKKTICNEMSKNPVHKYLTVKHDTEWTLNDRSAAIPLINQNTPLNVNGLTNAQIYFILSGDSKVVSTMPIVSDTCKTDDQPCSVYLESSDGRSSVLLDQATGAYHIYNYNGDYAQFWPEDSANPKNSPYYSKIDLKDKELKVFDANNKQIRRTDIGGFTPNTLQIRDDGDFLLRDTANNYNIWVAYAFGKNKGFSGRTPLW